MFILKVYTFQEFRCVISFTLRYLHINKLSDDCQTQHNQTLLFIQAINKPNLILEYLVTT